MCAICRIFLLVNTICSTKPRCSAAINVLFLPERFVPPVCLGAWPKMSTHFITVNRVLVSIKINMKYAWNMLSVGHYFRLYFDPGKLVKNKKTLLLPPLHTVKYIAAISSLRMVSIQLLKKKHWQSSNIISLMCTCFHRGCHVVLFISMNYGAFSGEYPLLWLQRTGFVFVVIDTKAFIPYLCIFYEVLLPFVWSQLTLKWYL